ncbi:MAG: DUF1684 domain-containing protein [Bacteroidota bacterium]
MLFLQLALISVFFSHNITESSANQSDNYKSDIENWQNELNSQFRDKDNSPLTEEGLSVFVGLNFYEVSQNYKVKAKFTLTPFEPVFKMKTNTARLPEYKIYGIAAFELNGKKFELNVYQNQRLMHMEGYEDYLFIPYTDLTSGNTSYAGGKYIEARIPKTDILIIDFNKSYNPYCAYNHKYSCPIPPRDNHLDIRIEAGVKAYTDLDDKSHH